MREAIKRAGFVLCLGIFAHPGWCVNEDNRPLGAGTSREIRYQVSDDYVIRC